MGKIAFVFSGQGAQKSGMGKTLAEGSKAALAVFETADLVRPGTSEQCFSGTDEELGITINTQPCLWCVDLAAAKALEEAGVKADAVAGFSLGEMAALTFAGVCDTKEGFDIVIKRAELMQAATEKFPGGMAAVLKLAPETVESLSAEHGVYPVNYNCPGQIVVAGEKDKLPAFIEAVTANGGRALPLAVSGGFHSPMMNEAAEEFKSFLATKSLSAPKIPIYANYTALPYDGGIAELASVQMKSPVRWQQTVENMVNDGYDTFIEVGVGKTLTGLIKKINKDVKVLTVNELDDVKAVADALSEVN